MAPHIEHDEHWLAKQLDQIDIRHRELSFDEVKAEYNSVLKRSLVFYDYIKLELQRRIAERTLGVAIAKNLGKQKCLQLLRRLEQLGYTDDDQEITYKIILSRYLLPLGHTQTVRRLLAPLPAKCQALEEGLSKPALKQRRQTQQVLNSLLAAASSKHRGNRRRS